MRELLTGATLDDAALAGLYTADTDADGPIVRLNMAATLDGSATGADGVSGSINTAADHVVFGLLRAWADVILVGSGTVAAEGYAAPKTERRWRTVRSGRPEDPALAVLSSTGRVPDAVRFEATDDVFGIRSAAGRPFGHVIEELTRRGHRRILCEGGPTIAGAAIRAGAVDELCLTWSPMLVGGVGARIAGRDPLEVAAAPLSLLEQDGTLIGRWQLT